MLQSPHEGVSTPWSQNRWDIWGEKEGEQEFELAGDAQKRSWWMLKAGPSPGLPKRVKLLLIPELAAQWDQLPLLQGGT